MERCGKKIHCRGEFSVAIQWKLSKMPPPPPGRRRVAAPENPLRRRISLCHSVETDDQDAAAAAWKEGTRRSLWKRRAASGLDELGPEPWVSLWINHFGEESTPPLAWTEGNKMPPAPPGRRGTRGIRAIKSTAVEELAPGLGEVAEKS